MKHARLLGVVCLHGNMFKPFTGTNTSFLLVQKWHGDEERIDAGDYRIFFATSQKSGKDNSGSYMWLDKESKERVRDTSNRKIGEDLLLDHDLNDIVEAFKAFAKEERLDFFA